MVAVRVPDTTRALDDLLWCGGRGNLLDGLRLACFSTFHLFFLLLPLLCDGLLDGASLLLSLLVGLAGGGLFCTRLR